MLLRPILPPYGLMFSIRDRKKNESEQPGKNLSKSTNSHFSSRKKKKKKLEVTLNLNPQSIPKFRRGSLKINVLKLKPQYILSS